MLSLYKIIGNKNKMAIILFLTETKTRSCSLTSLRPWKSAALKEATHIARCPFKSSVFPLAAWRHGSAGPTLIRRRRRVLPKQTERCAHGRVDTRRVETSRINVYWSWPRWSDAASTDRALDALEHALSQLIATRSRSVGRDEHSYLTLKQRSVLRRLK